MATAQTLIQDRLERGDKVVTIARDATVYDAARVMNDHRIGALVVTGGGRGGKGGGGARGGRASGKGGGVLGIFTERDLLKRVVAEGKRPEDTIVGDVMTTELIVCRPETPLDEIRQTMRSRKIRHMPVVGDDASLVGMISISDLNLAEAKVLTETISYLEQYMTSF